MTAPVPENWKLEREQITAALYRRRGRRRETNGELWVDHRCLFHDDAHQSASWQEQTGVYYCRTEDRTFAVPAVMDALFVKAVSSPGPGVPPSGTSRQTGRPETPKLPPDKRLARVFEYRFPDGRLSHRKYRVGDGAAKTIWQEGPDGERSLPAQVYPIYGDFELATGLHLLVVEGEKCVDLVQDVAEYLSDTSIRALTCGSSADLKHNAELLAARLRDLAPKTITLWPDNDRAGITAMDEVAKALRSLGADANVVDPQALGLAPKADVADYIMAGGQLGDVIRRAQLPHANGSLDALIGRLVVTHDGHVVFPDTRNLVSISVSNANAIWYHELHGMPKDVQAKELAARLQVKSHLMPTAVRPRQFNTPDATWWRPRSSGAAYHISAEGVRLSDDPPDVILLTPADELAYPVDVDLDGSRQDLLDLGKAFHLNETELIMCEGWLACALAGLQTPIMFMRAPAGTGKTTLARLLLAIVEPLCPEMEATAEREWDMRKLIVLLRSSQAVLLDNVSKLSASLEDQLSKMVTGYTTSLRPLYEDRVITTRLQRSLIITTTNYDVYKGDLAQRMIVTSPATEKALRWLPDSIAQQRFGEFIPRIRGWIFHRLVDFYRGRVGLDTGTIRFRIGDLGLMLAALGYDTAALAESESALKSEVIALDDPWLEALVALWKDWDSIKFWVSTADVLGYLKDYGIHELPPEKSPKLARYLAEKNPILRDHGFQVERKNTDKLRGWQFERVSDLVQSELLPTP